MTNWEKFKKIFEIPQNTTVEPDSCLCNMLDCDGVDCSSCPINKADMNNTSFWYREYKEIGTVNIKVGDIVRTLKDKDVDNCKVFPIGTIGKVVDIDKYDDELPYQVEANNTRWWYSRDMFEVVEREE